MHKSVLRDQLSLKVHKYVCHSQLLNREWCVITETCTEDTCTKVLWSSDTTEMGASWFMLWWKVFINIFTLFSTVRLMLTYLFKPGCAWQFFQAILSIQHQIHRDLRERKISLLYPGNNRSSMIGSTKFPLATISANTWHPCRWSAYPYNSL